MLDNKKKRKPYQKEST